MKLGIYMKPVKFSLSMNGETNMFNKKKTIKRYTLLVWSTSLAILCLMSIPVAAQRKFVHPGITNSKAELDFIKAKVNAGAEPWTSGYNKMMSSKVSSLSYQPRPCETVGFNICNAPIREDGAAVYSHALQYYIKGNKANAEKARQILNAWAEKNKTVLPNGSGGGCLISSWGFPRMIAGAEILRAIYPEWTASEISKFSNYLDKVVYPKSTNCNADNNNHEISGFANGLMMAIFLDDQSKYSAMLKNLTDFVKIYIIDPNGCTNESDRDQAHTMMGIGFLAWGAEAAYHQGDENVYNALDKRLYKSYEFVAKYNLGHSVDESGCQKKQSSEFRGSVSHTMWEVAYNHYHNRLKLPMPWTEQYVKKMRPEHLPDQEMPWGTLTHAELGNITGPIDPNPSLTFNLQLSPGWNMISLPIEPNNNGIDKVLSGIEGKYMAVHAYDGSNYQSYIPGASGNTLSTMSAGTGYWIFMTAAATLEIKGKAAPKTVQLKTGWNLVGYNSLTSQPVTGALASISGKYQAVYAYITSTNSYRGYIPESVAELTAFESGRGYWIYATSDVTWTIP
jgi:hypothetical protein